ncbi:MAG TPA: SAF domain-containing protein [Acidimicrobiales bacterium]
MPPPPWTLTVRARRALARPRARRAGVLVLAAATGLTVALLVGSVERARRQWGDTRPVAVARRDLHPGEVIDTATVELRHLPEVAVSSSALDHVPGGAIVRDPVTAGEPLVPARLAPMGLTGAAALVPDGHRAVAVPLGPTGAPPLQVGNRVDVLAVTGSDPGPGVGPVPTGPAGPDADGGTGPAFPVVEGARVIHVGDEAVTIAVPTEDAPGVALAVTRALAVLALAGG